MLKINVTILNHHPGSIIKEDEKDYERFLSWAEKKDRFQGNIICEIIPEDAIETTDETEKAELDPLECDQCDFIATSENGLKIHKSKAHKEE